VQKSVVLANQELKYAVNVVGAFVTTAKNFGYIKATLMASVKVAGNRLRHLIDLSGHSPGYPRKLNNSGPKIFHVSGVVKHIG